VKHILVGRGHVKIFILRLDEGIVAQILIAPQFPAAQMAQVFAA